MTLASIAGIIAGIVFCIAATWYVYDVATQKATASTATFSISTILHVSLAASLIEKGAWGSVPVTTAGAISSAFIFFFSLRNKRIYFELSDKLCLIGVTVGFIFWLIFKDALINLLIVAAINYIVFFPVVIKSFRRPELETI